MPAALILLFILLPVQCWAFSADVFLRASAATGIPVELLLAISHVESGFQPHAINISGAVSSHPQRAKLRDCFCVQKQCRYWPHADQLGLLGQAVRINQNRSSRSRAECFARGANPRILRAGQWKLAEGRCPLSLASRSTATGLRREGPAIVSPCAREARKMIEDNYHEKSTSCDGFCGRDLAPRLFESCLDSGMIILFSPSLSTPPFMTSG